MYENTIRDLIRESKNSYELVMKLKHLKQGGSRRIKCTYKSISIGKLMFIIVSLSKNGYSYSDIISEVTSY